MAFDAPGFIHGLSGSVFGGSGKAGFFRDVFVIRGGKQRFPLQNARAAFARELTQGTQVGMDQKVFDRLQFWEYLNMMEVSIRWLYSVPGVAGIVTPCACVGRRRLVQR
jgi:hypothetical protein